MFHCVHFECPADQSALSELRSLQHVDCSHNPASCSSGVDPVATSSPSEDNEVDLEGGAMAAAPMPSPRNQPSGAQLMAALARLSMDDASRQDDEFPIAGEVTRRDDSGAAGDLR